MALMGTGVVAGIMAGLLGVGGGIVIVPVLFYLFDVFEIPPDTSMHVAVGTSLATIIPTSFASLRAHLHHGAVDLELLRRWGVTIFLGSALGAALAGFVSGTVLTAVFASIALLVAVNMAIPHQIFVLAPALPNGRVTNAGISGLIGMFSAIMGIGGGTLSVPLLTLFSYPIHRAVGTASALGLLIACPGTLGFALAGIDVEGRPPASLGYVNLLGAALIFPMTVLMAPYGARLAHRLNRVWLRRAFALFLAVTALRMFASLLGQ